MSVLPEAGSVLVAVNLFCFLFSASAATEATAECCISISEFTSHPFLHFSPDIKGTVLAAVMHLMLIKSLPAWIS